MDFTLSQFLFAFFVSISVGVSLAVVYEPIRIFHRCGFNASIHYLVTDILFMIFCGIVTYFYSLAVLQGSVRFFVILGEISGFFLFRRFVSPVADIIYDPIEKICKKIFKKLLKTYGKIMYNIVKAFDAVSSTLRSFISSVLKRVKSYGKKSRQRYSEKRGKNKRSKTKAKEKK